MSLAPPLVSVVLPCYNAHRFLPQALDSVRAQSFRDFELIVIDDGSTDPETLGLLATLPADIRVVHQENRGLSGARNRGFNESRGRFVLPLDCDDWLEPDFLERAVAALAGREDCFAFAQLALEGEVQGSLVKNFNFFEQLFANQLPYCMLMSKDLWRAAGGYDESMRQGYEDWEFNIRLARTGARAVIVQQPLFHYRVSAGGMLQAISRKRHGALWQLIQDKHADLYRPLALWRCWRTWRRQPSTRPLGFYVLLLLGHRLLPDRLFVWLFNKAMFFSESHRLKRRGRAAAAQTL
jgi:GT2 family glycosyltransferase